MPAPTPSLLLPALALCCFFVGCDEPEKPAGQSSKSKSDDLGFTLSPEQMKKVAQLKPAKDPDQKTDTELAAKWRGEFERQEFDQLEKDVAELRNTKALTGSGRWKIMSFYEALVPAAEEKEEKWQEHAKIHEGWMATKPESIAARVAHAEFLVNYAWKARGTGYADTVTEEGGRLMERRLATARQILVDAQTLKEQDPMYFQVTMGVALGEGWPPEVYDDLLARAHQLEPTFWMYDASRAYSLLPRWYGEKGDWEAYADKAAARPDGLGAETYARIVIYLFRFHDNIFRDSKASWPKTREGLKIMLKKYPNSVEVLHRAALLATFGNDRTMAKELFDKIGDTYLPSVYRKPEVYEHYRHWADTGNW